MSQLPPGPGRPPSLAPPARPPAPPPPIPAGNGPFGFDPLVLISWIVLIQFALTVAYYAIPATIAIALVVFRMLAPAAGPDFD